MKIFNKHAPRKKNFARGNQISLMTQDFSRDIIRRSRLWNRFSKNKSQENRMPYEITVCFQIILLRKTKIRYFANLDEKKILDNKQFWRVV